MQRLQFNVQLMQTLALSGITVKTLTHAGILKGEAIALLANAQAPLLRNISSANDAQRFLPVQELGMEFALAYLHIMKCPENVLRRINPDRMEREILGVKRKRKKENIDEDGGENGTNEEVKGERKERFIRASADMVWRALGISNPYRVPENGMQNIEIRTKLERLIQDLGLAEVQCIDARKILENMLATRGQYDAIISGARPY